MSKSTVNTNRPGSILVKVIDTEAGLPVAHAAVSVYPLPPDWKGDCLAFNNSHGQGWSRNLQPRAGHEWTDEHGKITFPPVAAHKYVVTFDHYPIVAPLCVEVAAGCSVAVNITLDLQLTVRFAVSPDAPERLGRVLEGDRVYAIVDFADAANLLKHGEIRTNSPWLPVPGHPQAFTMQVPSAGRFPFEATLLLAHLDDKAPPVAVPVGGPRMLVDAAGHGPGLAAAAGTGVGSDAARVTDSASIDADARAPSPVSGNITVSMSRTETEITEDVALWTLIRNSTEALGFTSYLHFIDGLFCHPNVLTAGSNFEQQRFAQKQSVYHNLKGKRFLPFVDADAYRVLKAATEAFVMVNCGVISTNMAFDSDEDSGYLDRRDIPTGGDLPKLFGKYLESEDGTQMLPYLAVIRRKLPDIPIVKGPGHEEDLCFGIVQKKLSCPCMIELIWSYWQEEGMLVQTMNAITQRFQNVRAIGANDPLANLEIDPLRPLNNLIWGYTQDEQHRLTVVRRNYEYDHHYGVRLDGKAVQEFRPADSRSKFLEAFHFLLRLATAFFRQDDDTTVKADAFPVLNALREVHLILSQGAHNQFGDLPSTARVEMLMQQWLLARPEFREFLPTRIMVAYPEPWMDRVDAMKKLQGWSDTSVMHFRNLAIFGEQLLLSIRYGNWSDIYESTPAFNWVRFWRPQIQGYIHSYRAATGVDLAVDARDPDAEGTLPSILLRQRLAQQLRSSI